MAKLNVAPTKSNLLSLKRQLAFAQEGYDLLEQKRQILIFELMRRLQRVREAQSAISRAIREAHEALREAELDIGTTGIDRALMGARDDIDVELETERLMGIQIPRVRVQEGERTAAYGLGGTSSSTDEARKRFLLVVPLLAELAELEITVLRLSNELRKTQRRCNALSTMFIPRFRETIAHISGCLEERERESFVILKMIRDRLEAGRGEG
jgi:V/A-type H+-transporting ATPase subunit D